MGLGTQENKLKKKKYLIHSIPKLFFYVKSIHLRGSCRKVKKAVRRRMPLEKMSKINHRLFKQAMIILPLKALKLGSLLQAGLVRTVV